jgi:hypothetical protein
MTYNSTTERFEPAVDYHVRHQISIIYDFIQHNTNTNERTLLTNLK